MVKKDGSSCDVVFLVVNQLTDGLGLTSLFSCPLLVCSHYIASVFSLIFILH